MKLFSQAALIIAMTAAASSAFAMQAMTETDMSATTGQDGITIKVDPRNSVDATSAMYIDNVVIHDKDGYNASNQAGAITMGIGATGTGTKFKVLSPTGIQMIIDADGGNATGTSPFLNIKLDMGATVITTGDIWVTNSLRKGIAVGTSTLANAAVKGIGSTAANQAKIMNSFDVELNGLTTNIQLGNQAQGSMIKVSGTMANGFSLVNFGLTDADGYGLGTGVDASGSIQIGRLTLSDSGATTALTLNSTVDVNTEGLVVSMKGGKTDVVMQDIRLGNISAAANSIGDVALLGVDAQGTKLTIMGH